MSRHKLDEIAEAKGFIKRISCPYPGCPETFQNQSELTKHLEDHYRKGETAKPIPLRTVAPGEEKLTYFQKLRKGICPECGHNKIVVMEGYEYVRRAGKEIKETYPAIRCSQCGKTWTQNVLITRHTTF